MRVAEFPRALEHLTADDFHRIAATLVTHSESAADEVDAWRVTMTIHRVLRRTHQTRVAAHAPSPVTHTALKAASVHGISLPDGDVTPVARAAAPIARRLVS